MDNLIIRVPRLTVGFRPVLWTLTFSTNHKSNQLNSKDCSTVSSSYASIVIYMHVKPAISLTELHFANVYGNFMHQLVVSPFHFCHCRCKSKPRWTTTICFTTCNSGGMLHQLLEDQCLNTQGINVQYKPRPLCWRGTVLEEKNYLEPPAPLA